MERTPVTYKTFWTIFINREPSTPSVLCLIRDFAFRRKLASKTAMAFMIASMIFVLGFPTLASAMTGYKVKTKAYVQAQNQQFIPFSEFSPVWYVIHDGSRINLTDEYMVTAVNLTADSGGNFGRESYSYY